MLQCSNKLGPTPGAPLPFRKSGLKLKRGSLGRRRD